MLTSSVEDSPASQLVVLGKGKAKKTRAGYGRSSAESFAAFGPNGCLSKMYRGCYLLTLEGSLLEYCETFPKAGMMQNGILYRLPALEPHTSEKGCSLWRTPNSKVIDAKSTVVKLTGRTPKDPQVGLADQVLAAECGMWPTPEHHTEENESLLWPTPTAGMWKHTERPELAAKYISQGKISLPRAVKTSMLPTPCSTDWKISSKPGQRRGQLIETQIGGQLNPMWVEWLMGFPLGWTDLEPSETP